MAGGVVCGAGWAVYGVGCVCVGGGGLHALSLRSEVVARYKGTQWGGTGRAVGVHAVVGGT